MGAVVGKWWAVDSAGRKRRDASTPSAKRPRNNDGHGHVPLARKHPDHSLLPYVPLDPFFRRPFHPLPLTPRAPFSSLSLAECGVAIPPNPINTCVQCLQTRYDIGAGVAKQVQQHTCRGCNRYERRDGSWAAVEPEFKELLAILLKKPRGLGAVRLADASFIWTEEHSKRLKLRVTIQKEVVAGAVLQQSFVIEYVIGNKQCPHCQRREAKDTWTAVVQLRQKVAHKRTLLWIEQLILRHGAHSDSVNITELKDGLDFFFDQRSHAEKLVSFLQSVAPTRYKTSRQLISQDTHTGKNKDKVTFSVEVLPVCKDDLVWIPRSTANSLGQLSQLAVCSKVSNVVHLLDPFTLKVGELQPIAYWKAPFKSAPRTRIARRVCRPRPRAP